MELKQAPLAISPKTLPHATAGQPYHVQLHATGGLDTDYAFALAEGSTLPADLTLSKDGLISGTPKKSGTFSFTVVVGDPVTRTYQLVVDPVAASPSSSAGSSTSTSTSSSAASPSSSGGSPAGSGAPLANTGASAGLQLWWAALLLGAGIALLAAGSLHRASARRH